MDPSERNVSPAWFNILDLLQSSKPDRYILRAVRNVLEEGEMEILSDQLSTFLRIKTRQILKRHYEASELGKIVVELETISSLSNSICPSIAARLQPYLILIRDRLFELISLDGSWLLSTREYDILRSQLGVSASVTAEKAERLVSAPGMPAGLLLKGLEALGIIERRAVPGSSDRIALAPKGMALADSLKLRISERRFLDRIPQMVIRRQHHLRVLPFLFGDTFWPVYAHYRGIDRECGLQFHIDASPDVHRDPISYIEKVAEAPGRVTLFALPTGLLHPDLVRRTQAVATISAYVGFAVVASRRYDFRGGDFATHQGTILQTLLKQDEIKILVYDDQVDVYAAEWLRMVKKHDRTKIVVVKSNKQLVDGVEYSEGPCLAICTGLALAEALARNLPVLHILTDTRETEEQRRLSRNVMLSMLRMIVPRGSDPSSSERRDLMYRLYDVSMRTSNAICSDEEMYYQYIYDWWNTRRQRRSYRGLGDFSLDFDEESLIRAFKQSYRWFNVPQIAALMMSTPPDASVWAQGERWLYAGIQKGELDAAQSLYREIAKGEKSFAAVKGRLVELARAARRDEFKEALEQRLTPRGAAPTLAILESAEQLERHYPRQDGPRRTLAA